MTTEETYVVVAHNQFLSIQDLTKQKWNKHVKFPEGKINKFFQIENPMGSNDIGVLLETGDLFVIEMKNIPDIISQDTYVEGGYFQAYTIGRELIHFCQDKKENKFVLMAHRQDDIEKCTLLYQGRVFDI